MDQPNFGFRIKTNWLFSFVAEITVEEPGLPDRVVSIPVTGLITNEPSRPTDSEVINWVTDEFLPDLPDFDVIGKINLQRLNTVEVMKSPDQDVPEKDSPLES